MAPSSLKYDEQLENSEAEIEPVYLSKKKRTNCLARWMEVVKKKSLRGGCWKNNPTDILVAYEKLILFVCIFIYLWKLDVYI